VIKNARYASDDRPIDEGCECRVCRRYSRAYLRHLFQSNEALSAVLNSYHNLYFYLDTMRQIRDAIASFTLRDYLRERVGQEEAG
jgi:queuine tRNA-ribosyltransferase